MYRGYLPCSSSSGRHREIRVAQFASKRSPAENHRNGSRYLVPAATITQGPGCVLNGFHQRKALDMWQKLRHGNSQKFGSPVRQSLPPCSGPPTTPNHRTPEERGFRNDPLLASDPKNPPKIVVRCFVSSSCALATSHVKNISDWRPKPRRGSYRSPIALPHVRAAHAHATTPPSPLPRTSLNTLG